jgi:hypothetical protein
MLLNIHHACDATEAITLAAVLKSNVHRKLRNKTGQGKLRRA